MEDIDPACSDNSDHEINEAQHSSLLDAVSQLDVKQRVKPPSRKEPSFQVSEFHLGKNDANKHAVLIRNLTKSLGQQGSHAVITKQLRSIHRKAKTLPQPLEKPVAARIQRSVGFRNVKIQLGRWDAVVYSNRAADQLSFPLKQSTVSFQTTNDFISKLKSQTRTPLEQQMDEILNNSPAVQEERKEEEVYQLSLAEMRERRREMAKLRAQQSYMASKASRQKKIKSKKYHRILRRERIRQQLKDFEVLQKTDPEAALQQLEQLERTRAEERVSLRHRSTGQWARNKAVRAKYDKESRQELAQQLAVSRELTQKIQVENSSDEEAEEENCENRVPSNNDNPWIAPKTTSEVDEFVSEYRKYWEERNKKSSVETSSTNEIAAHNKGEDGREVESDIRKGRTKNHETAPANKNIKEEDLMGSHSLESVNTRDKNDEDICIDIQILVKEGQKCTDAINNTTETPTAQHSTLEEISSGTEVQSKRKQLLPNEENDTAERINNSTEILRKEERLSPKKRKSTGEDLNSSTLMHPQMKNVSPSKQKSTAEQENDSTKIIPKWISLNKLNTPEEQVNTSSGVHQKRNISPNKQENITEEVNSNIKMQLKRKKLSQKKRNAAAEQVNSKKKKKPEFSFNTDDGKFEPMECHSTVIATTNSWVVTPIVPEMRKMVDCNELEGKCNKQNKRNSTDKSTKKNEVKIGKLFDDMQEKLKEKVDKKLKKLKLEMNIKDKDKAEDTNSESDNEGPSLKLKQVNVQANLDEELIEQPHDGLQETESSNMNLDRIVAESRLEEEQQEPPADNIDPNKFIAMKPKHLQTELPDIVTGGDEAIDDNEDDSTERQMTITEAFAEDDVVAEFRKEKEEVTDKSQPKSIDLSLPGWGEWGGKNLPVSSRKKRRFIMKFPAVAPRKDTNKGSVIINEEKNNKVVSHQVSELPFPFTSVKDFEASIRAPIGNTWIPETAHRKLTKPSVITKLGTIIKPMDEDMLVNKEKKVKGMP